MAGEIICTFSHLVDITGVDDVMASGRNGDENRRAVTAHLRLQAHLCSWEQGLGLGRYR